MTMKAIATLAGIAALSFAATASPASAQALARSDWGRVTQLEAGWVVNSMGVYHSAPIVNPGGCAVTNAGYATNPADGGVDLFHTLIITALLNQRDIAFLVQGCFADKPHIISVSVR